MSAVSPPTGLPHGARLRLNEHVRRYDDGRVLVGGSPGRLMRLSARALAMLDGDALDVGAGTAVLAERLLDAGLMDPAPSSLPQSGLDQMSVVIPVRDRSRQLDRLLAGLPVGVHVLVVDDASERPDLVIATAERHGAEVLTLPTNGGPAGARNRGFEATGTPFVAFVDSDVVPGPGAFEVLLRHFADPRLAMVAPRILGLEPGSARPHGSGALTRYEAAMSSLDRGPDPALVRPMSRVAWLPSACVVVRRDVFESCAGFSEEMRVGEDVDLVWRLTSAGHRVRYEPAASVRHEHRATPASWLTRKAVYGTSAAPLASRHGTAVAPAVFAPWTAVLAAAVLAQRRWSLPVVGLAWATVTVRLAMRFRSLGDDAPLGWSTAVRMAARLTCDGARSSLEQSGALALRHWWPAVLPLTLVSSRARRIVAAAAVVDAITEWRRVRPGLDPLSFLVARRLDDLAYGAGVWTGAVRSGSARALLPRFGGSGGVRRRADGSPAGQGRRWFSQRAPSTSPPARPGSPA
ncbi:mycofactocin biosynthesis glycosyltransferase MftF [Janibacter sp. Soil728]|uniref:mycofactocin biosynthesis glycosyltransferase MftF n=1 Tax=Janibacter sp. Soil728 TaxID=1736393 RepID=UPI001910F318|nr:mycofactocin biosynthesis glycosyltransferase MftF [Janibacter sp. Soil728]